MQYRNLEKIRSIVADATGLEITYAYDDLVFPDNTAFIIQYDDKDENIFLCYFHKDCAPKERKMITGALKSAAQAAKSTILPTGAFELKQVGDEVEIKFHI